MHRLLVHLNELSIDHDLIELRFHSRDELIQNIPEREVRARVDLRQSLRADLNDHAFGAFDLLLRVEESRILLQRHQDRLIESKSRNPGGGTCSITCSGACITRPAKDADGCKNAQDNKRFSHRDLAIRRAETSARI